MKKDLNTYDNALAYAVNLINKYTYTEKKLVNKLNSKNISKNNITKVINYLKEHKLIDDYAYGHEVATYMLERNKDEKQIKLKLINLGIKEEDIVSILKSLNFKPSMIDNDYKLYKLKYSNDKDIINALKKKGYSYSKIKSVMEKDYDIY